LPDNIKDACDKLMSFIADGNFTTQASEDDDFVLAGHKDTLEERFEKRPF